MVTGTTIRGRTSIGMDVDTLTKIKVVGVGGGGNNALNRMIEEGIWGVDFIAVNTDAQDLVRSRAPDRIRIGDRFSGGLGVGGDHELGMKAAEESRDLFANAIGDANVLFVTAGMGGGTGTGAAPVIADVAKKLGALTIAVVTRPFAFEGTHRSQVADEGIMWLEQRTDSLIVVPNERLLGMCDRNVTIDSAFKIVDDVLLRSVQGISGVIVTSGEINLDFMDVKATMTDAGHTWISMGHGSGDNRVVDAARSATVNPLFDYSIEKAERILFNITGNELGLAEVNEAANLIKQVADPHAKIFFGWAKDPNMGNDVKIALIATGFEMRKKSEYTEGSAEADSDFDEIDDYSSEGEEQFESPSDGKWRSFLPRFK
ncbi:MAG: cell division protein FtsZ [Chloroflexota bacterium]|nr:cell division protein FtsZ [Chloroflexota bacterium]